MLHALILNLQSAAHGMLPVQFQFIPFMHHNRKLTTDFHLALIDTPSHAFFSAWNTVFYFGVELCSKISYFLCNPCVIARKIGSGGGRGGKSRIMTGC